MNKYYYIKFDEGAFSFAAQKLGNSLPETIETSEPLPNFNKNPKAQIPKVLYENDDIIHALMSLLLSV